MLTEGAVVAGNGHSNGMFVEIQTKKGDEVWYHQQGNGQVVEKDKEQEPEGRPAKPDSMV